jgi:Mrp family chromosome partitioning ATPase
VSGLDAALPGLFDVLATRIRGTKLRTIGFTSTVFGEGASTVALGTCLSLASLERAPVLLVDANWLHPSLTHDAGATVRPGLTDVLQGHAALDEVLVPTSRPRLVFMPAGDLSGERPELDALASLLDEALARFGTIVVDLPPALAREPVVLPWAMSLQQLFIVVRSGVTPLALIRQVVEEVGVTRPQVVLNRMPERTPEWASARRLAAT